ncbi:MAG: helix-turn-helix transcriptional regulator [Elusimicrobia bacterium]|nr:helix-turn-helix transcriptional regulator [Elusimicrobiota bacterium]
MRGDIYSILEDEIREERKQAGLTMERLAGLAGISASFLAYIETKGRKASLETVQKLAEALRIPVARLFETAPGPGKDAVYTAARRFAQLIPRQECRRDRRHPGSGQIRRKTPPPEIEACPAAPPGKGAEKDNRKGALAPFRRAGTALYYFIFREPRSSVKRRR